MHSEMFANVVMAGSGKRWFCGIEFGERCA